MVEVRFFAALRERVGTEKIELALPDTVGTIGQLVALLAERDPQLARALEATPRRMVALNEALSDTDAAVKDGDVVAIFPPVTGG